MRARPLRQRRAKSRGGAGKGKGKSDEHAEPEYTRADFQKLSRVLQVRVCSMNSDGVVGSEVLEARMVPRVFSTGTVGWFFNNKIPLGLEGGKVVYCQAQFSFMAIGSKHWEAGEGYSPDGFPRDPLAPENETESARTRPEEGDASEGHPAMPPVVASMADSIAGLPPDKVAPPDRGGMDLETAANTSAEQEMTVEGSSPEGTAPQNGVGTDLETAVGTSTENETAVEVLPPAKVVEIAGDASAEQESAMEGLPRDEVAPTDGVGTGFENATDTSTEHEIPIEGLPSEEAAPPDGIPTDLEDVACISAEKQIAAPGLPLGEAAPPDGVGTGLENAAFTSAEIALAVESLPPEKVDVDLGNIADTSEG